jgi:hypothetical protein
LAIAPVDVHVMLWLDPTAQLSPPLGEVTVIEGVGIIENTASLVSLTLGEATALTFTRQVADSVSGTAQG